MSDVPRFIKPDSPQSHERKISDRSKPQALPAVNTGFSESTPKSPGASAKNSPPLVEVQFRESKPTTSKAATQMRTAIGVAKQIKDAVAPPPPSPRYDPYKPGDMRLGEAYDIKSGHTNVEEKYADQPSKVATDVREAARVQWQKKVEDPQATHHALTTDGEAQSPQTMIENPLPPGTEMDPNIRSRYPNARVGGSY